MDNDKRTIFLIYCHLTSINQGFAKNKKNRGCLFCENVQQPVLIMKGPRVIFRG